jgi:ABC-type multidrug transport system permease subunit
VGKTLPYLVISLVATALILVSARVLFGVVVKGSYLDLFGATLIFLMGTLGLGLFISSVAESQAMAFQAGAVSAARRNHGKRAGRTESHQRSETPRARHS